MTLFGRKLGRASGDTGRDIRTVFDYIAYLVERLEYSSNQTEKTLGNMDQKSASFSAALDSMGQTMTATDQRITTMEQRLAALEQTATAAAQEEEG